MDFTKERRIYRSTMVQRGFLGYHPEMRIGNGEWFHEENLSSRAFPLLCPREPRRRLLEGELCGLGSLNGLCYIQGSTLRYGDRSMDLPLTEGEKELISFGALLIVVPDMIWVNTVDHSYDYCQKGERFSGDMGICWCDPCGEQIEPVVDGTQAPENPEQYWLDTGSSPPVLKAYSVDTGLWYELPDPCLRIVADGIGADFPEGSRILIRGDEELEWLLGTGLHQVLCSGRDYLVIEGRIPAIRMELQNKQWELCCPVPKMDFLLHHENRLWGCRYGTDHNGNFVNEIYASALGDATAWYSFRGIASDSYVASLGAEGPFTGAAVVGGYPVFFKENSLHRIYGSRPSSFRIQSAPCVGVARGSERSTASIDNGLMYLGRDGFYIYDGSLPVKVSSDLDSRCYSRAVAGVRGRLYYADVLEDGVPVTLCYDREHKLWHRESPMEARAMVTVGQTLYYLCPRGLCAVGTAEGVPIDAPVQWEAVTGILREEEPREGYVAALRLRLTMEPGSSLSVYGEYDSSGVWEPLGTFRTRRLSSEEVPLRVKRCDHLRLGLKGRGQVTVHTLIICMEG